MTALNVVNVQTINGKTAYANLTTISANVITNASNSNSLVKLNHITLANWSASLVTANVNIARGTSNYYIAGTVNIPSNSTLTVLGKDTATYLEEGDVLQSYASANASVHIFASYEIMS